MKLYEHVARIEEYRNSYKMLVEKNLQDKATWETKW
jgi:hypothetical protein